MGFGVKMPLFPLHGWLPLAHVEAPSPVSILLSGILLKMGSYGLLRAIDILPAAAIAMQGLLFALGVIGLLYGGLLAWRQSDMKKMIAYSSVSHMGVVLIGISTLNVHGMTGAVYQMVAHGLVAGATFMLIGLLYERTHTRDINDYGSLIKVTPRFAFLIILAFVGGVGLPSTAGFVAELHVLIGGFETLGLGYRAVVAGGADDRNLQYPHRQAALHRPDTAGYAAGGRYAPAGNGGSGQPDFWHAAAGFLPHTLARHDGYVSATPD